MTMEYNQWKEILSAVNADKNLSKDNVIEKIKGELPQDSDEYKEQSEANFDVNYQFEMERMPRGEGYQTGMGPILDLSCTLLGLATINGYTKVVDVLAKAEADVSKVLGEGNTPLHLAAYYGHTEIADILIKAGANPSAASDSENTPLHWAAYKGYRDTVNLLIKARANLDAVNYGKDTPLHWAVFGNHEEVVSILIKAGANLNAVNGCKETPLNRAAKYNNTKMFDILTKAGADLLTFDKNGHVRQFLEKKVKKNGLYAGGASALLGTAAAVALFATGTVAVELIPIVIAVAAIATTALVVGGATYMMLKPSTKMDGVKGQGLEENEQEIWS